MTITANPVRNQYTSAPNQTVFNYTIYSDNDLNVYVTPAGQAPDDSADLITSYTVDPGTIGNQGGGFITLDTGANSGDIITIASAIQYDRETDYQTNGDFSPETVNGDIDRVVSLVKQNKGDINRAILLPESGDVNSEPISIPNPEDDKGIKWDGGNLVNTSIVEEVKTDTLAIPLVSTSGNTVTVKGLKQGPSILLTDEGDDVRIDALSPAGGNVRTDFDNTYDAGTTQNFDAATADSISTTSATADTMSVGGVDVTTKNNQQDAAIAAAGTFSKTIKGGKITFTASEDSIYSLSSSVEFSASGAGSRLDVVIVVLGVNNRTGTKLDLISTYSTLSDGAKTAVTAFSGINSGSNFLYTGLLGISASQGSTRGMAIGSIDLKAGDSVEAYVSTQGGTTPIASGLSLTISESS